MHINLNEDYNVAVDKALLGYLGETNSRPITFEGLEVEEADTYAMLIKYGEGAGSTYEVPITNNKMIVTAGVLYKAGDVRCQIVAKKFSGNEYKFVKKSDIFNLRVGNTLSDVGEIPTPEESQSLLDQILAQEKTIAKATSDANAATTAANKAKTSADTAADNANKAAESARAVLGQVAVVNEDSSKTYSAKLRIRGGKPVIDYEEV